MIKNIFFENLNGHTFDLSRLVWLSRWIGEFQMIDPKEKIVPFDKNNFSFMKCNHEIRQKRISLLTKIWKKSYFIPFSNLENSRSIVNNDHSIYVVALSSTVPGMIRLTYWNNGIKHHRISLEEYDFEDINEVIDYDPYRLEFVIQKHIQQYSYSKGFLEYIQPDENNVL
jgi:hypothetical protein